MKFSVTITDASAAELASLFASLGGTATTINIPTPAGSVTVDEDDDNQPVNADAPAVDANGLPWDERIHSASKAMTSDGSWRKRRGVSDQLVKQVEAELRGTVTSTPTADNGVTVRAEAPATTGPVVPPSGSVPSPATTTGAIADFTAQVAAAAAPQQPALTFPQFMQQVMAAMNAGKVDNAYIGSVLQRVGVEVIPALSNDPDKLNMAVNIMRQEGKL